MRVNPVSVRCATVLLVTSGSACTVTYPVVGQFENYNEVMVGEVNADLLAGRSTIRTKAKNSDLECDGFSAVTHIPVSNYIVPGFCHGQSGTADLTCSDGRRIRASWNALSCKRGFGTGADQNGARFSFTFGMDEDEAKEYIAVASKEVAEKPPLPSYAPKEVRKERGYSIGTGFFVSTDGQLVTNYHVVEDSHDITVIWQGKEYKAQTLKLDPANDVALLKVEAATLALRVSDTKSAQKAEDVMTLGYPLINLIGQEQKAAFGRVNALSGIQGDIRFMQIDVPIQPGNSGGPLLTRNGDVIGVVTATLNQLAALRASGALPQNVNYAVKSDYVLPLLPSQTIAKSSNPKPMEFTDVVKSAEKSVVLIVAK